MDLEAISRIQEAEKEAIKITEEAEKKAEKLKTDFEEKLLKDAEEPSLRFDSKDSFFIYTSCLSFQVKSWKSGIKRSFSF